ncbi:MAG: DEAD/DEAH box helicase family protein [Candidatus Omnitrophica bacterium]|nr:DEAD/DEAH box helicase family protein [Candidatus Omnitrophota bacterium]
MFNIENFKAVTADNIRFEKQKKRLSKGSINTSFIENAVTAAIKNLVAGTKSFVIYGEPQSGKTEMMICLTAKLLDQDRKIIVVLLNDNVELLKQNLRRFKESGIDPDPKNFSEVIDSNVEIGTNKWIIFCKKNARDLRKLIEKLRGQTEITVIDDEADYASPNAKINQGEITTINRLVGDLLGEQGTYIGVTATPARLDLNNTFDNANNHWVKFPPHEHYTGQDIFFPMNLSTEFKYCLTPLPDQGDDPKYLRRALFGFYANVGYLNTEVNKQEKNYCMLVHTSGKRADHTDDYKQIQKIINILKDSNLPKFINYVQELWEIAKERFGEEKADGIVKYALKTISRCSPVVMNSDVDKKNVDYTNATYPTTPFTIAIGGNIISRGVTFHNLLSMFFTRDVKHKIQQDTYIQRARMFGSRNDYLKYFELTIPEHLFLDWHKCFVFHRLAWESINSGNGAPVWLEDNRVAAVAANSLDKATVAIDSGEMGFGIFDLNEEIQKLVQDAYDGGKSCLIVLKEFLTKLGNASMPQYVIQYVENFMPEGDASIAIHKAFSIANYKDAQQDKIERAKGFIGNNDIEKSKFPQAIHHFKIFYNTSNKARIYYRYIGNIKFLKNLKRHLNEQ